MGSGLEPPGAAVPTGPETVSAILDRLRLCRARASGSSPWGEFGRPTWPRLFQLLDLGVQLDAIRWSDWSGRLDESNWNLLQEIESQGALLEYLRESPTVSPGVESLPVFGEGQTEAALADWRRDGVVAIDCLPDAESRLRVTTLFAAEQARHAGDFRRELSGVADPEWFELVDHALARSPARDLLRALGRIERQELTLSSQELLPQGIGWHRDLYWPQPDHCVSIIVTLDGNSVADGGEFLAWLPEGNRQVVHARQPFEATLLRNGLPRKERLFHAVQGYARPGLRRDTLVVQVVFAPGSA